MSEFNLDESHRFYDFVAQLYPKEVILSQSRSEAESIFLEEIVRRMIQLLDKGNTSEVKSLSLIHISEPTRPY